MKLNNKFWWFLAISVSIILGIIVTTSTILWYYIPLQDKVVILNIIKEYFTYLFAAGILILAGLGFALDGVFHNYVIPISRLSEEAVLINSVNPLHRIQIDGSNDIARLGEVINAMADRHELLQASVRHEIEQAMTEAENEKNILAQLISELPEGVLICNAQGRVLLYNRQAKHFFGERSNGGQQPGTGRFIGVGRSIFDVIDKNLMVHALEEISRKLDNDESNPTSIFVVADREGQLLRVEAAPILNPQRQMAGFILILFDITHQLEAEYRLNYLHQSLIREMRASLAGIRLTIETLLQYPEIDKQARDKFDAIIHKETLSLSRLLERDPFAESKRPQTQWPLATVTVKDLGTAIAHRAAEKLGVEIDLPAQNEGQRVRVDSYSLTLAVLFVLQHIHSASGCDHFVLEISSEKNYVSIDLIWKGAPVKIEALRQWKAQPLVLGEETMPLTLKAVLDHHHAEIWSYAHAARQNAYVRLLLPAVADRQPQAEAERRLTILPRSRPEFYDFDLFNQPGQSLTLDNRPLTELTYTVFDTETTGLDPQGGDRIISIGAIRIVNSRLRHDDIFDQLIDPQRRLPEASIEIHGIQPQMLEGQPTIEKVLPVFHHFSQDTILLAHNAAFDMRMLQMYENDTDIKFDQPVLDTLLLSSVVHPAQKDHNMEAISKRLGISILGRHTALGDAVTTGEIFLKLIPLLANLGIHTLKQARLASQKSYYARLKY